MLLQEQGLMNKFYALGVLLLLLVLFTGCMVHHVQFYSQHLESLSKNRWTLDFVPLFDCGPDRICIVYVKRKVHY